jgi:hypothetical protein
MYKIFGGDVTPVSTVFNPDDATAVDGLVCAALLVGSGAAGSRCACDAGTGVSMPIKLVQIEQAFSYSRLCCPHLGHTLTNVVM